MDRNEAKKLESYLKKTLKSPLMRVVPHAKKKELAEVYVGEEFIGTLYRDEEEGELSWSFSMAILEMDLEGEG